MHGLAAPLDEQHQQVEVARDERHLLGSAEQRAAGRRDDERSETVADLVCHVRCSIPAPSEVMRCAECCRPSCGRRRRLQAPWPRPRSRPGRRGGRPQGGAAVRRHAATRLIRNAVVIVEGGKIKAVGSGLAGARRGARSSTSATPRCCPGFIDAHTHLTGESADNWLQGAIERHAAQRAGDGDPRHRLRAPHADGRLHHRARRRRRATSSTSGCATPSTAGVVPGPRMLVAVQLARRPRRPLRPAPASRTCCSASEPGIADGIASGRRRLPRRRALPGQVRRRRHQGLRHRRRAVA